MYFEKITEEIEEWLEKADKEEHLKFIGESAAHSLEGATVIEMLGYYGSVNQLVAKEIQKMNFSKKKIGGIFSSYFSEMVQIISGEILLPITLQKIQIGDRFFILTTSSFAIPDVIGYPLAEELYLFYKKHKVSKIVLIDGAYNDQRLIEKRPQVHKISSVDFKIEIFANEKADFTMMGQIASSFLTYWSHDPEIPIEIITVDSFSDYDPISSLEILKVLAQDLQFNVDFNELKRKSHEFKKEILDSEQSAEIKQQYEDSDNKFFI